MVLFVEVQTISFLVGCLLSKIPSWRKVAKVMLIFFLCQSLNYPFVFCNF